MNNIVEADELTPEELAELERKGQQLREAYHRERMQELGSFQKFLKQGAIISCTESFNISDIAPAEPGGAECLRILFKASSGEAFTLHLAINPTNHIGPPGRYFAMIEPSED